MLVLESSPRGYLLSATEIQPSATPPRSGIAADGWRSVICWGNFVHGCRGLSWCDVSCCWSGCTLTFTLGWCTAGWKIEARTHTHIHTNTQCILVSVWGETEKKVKLRERVWLVVVFCGQKWSMLGLHLNVKCGSLCHTFDPDWSTLRSPKDVCMIIS